MSVRFDGSTDSYSATTGLPGTTFTALFWARIAVDRNAYSSLVGVDNGTGDQVLNIQTDQDGVSPYLWLAPHSPGYLEESPAVPMTVGSWYRFALVRSGTAVTFYAAAATGGVSSVSGTLTGTLNQTTLRIGHSPTAGEWFNGNFANLKIYNAALTAGEIETEWGNWQAQRTTALLRHHRWQTAAETTDYSGNGHVLTAAGSPTFEATNPSLADSAPGGGTGGGGGVVQVGKTTNGAGETASTADKAAVSRFTAAVGGVLTAGHARLRVTGGSATTRLVAYADTGAAPGVLLAQSDAKTITNTAEALVDYVFSGANRISITSGTDYWIGPTWQDPGAESLVFSRDETANARREASAYAPNPFGTPASLSGPIDVYVDVEVGATGGGTGLLRAGSAALTALRVGSAALLRAYLGTTLVWGSAPSGGGGAGSFTGGSGGPLTDRTSVSYNNGTKTSTYHVYAAGLDWTKRVGLLVYGDGSGEQGLSSPSSTYLMAGTNGLIAVAKKHNMLLVTPRAPGNGCTDGDGVCWYLPSNDGTTLSQKTKWLDDLIKTQVLPLYNLDKTRVCISGFSSGAELTMGTYSPQYAASWMEDGLLLAISFGSSPNQYGIPNNYTAAFKSKVAAVWNVRGGDTTGAVPDSLEGYNYYNSNGFATTLRTVIPGGEHDRPGEFGGLVDQYIPLYVDPA